MKTYNNGAALSKNPALIVWEFVRIAALALL